MRIFLVVFLFGYIGQADFEQRNDEKGDVSPLPVIERLHKKLPPGKYKGTFFKKSCEVEVSPNSAGYYSAQIISDSGEKMFFGTNARLNGGRGECPEVVIDDSSTFEVENLRRFRARWDFNGYCGGGLGTISRNFRSLRLKRRLQNKILVQIIDHSKIKSQYCEIPQDWL